ncbi:MAG: hypothetical protein KF799_09510 [Bdellovibrionales bacterium]|nr:hypothetical protein [Bdellovibrionales bacterium]
MRALTLGWIICGAFQAWAHGEDKPGPQGGFISMPGAFHVELVPVSEQQLKVYLLDLHWKNPTLKDSSIKLSHGSTSARCTERKDHFVCDFPMAVNLKEAGELKVDATREGQKGTTVRYSLPLRLEKHH